VWYNTRVNRTINKWERGRKKRRIPDNDRNQFVDKIKRARHTRTDFSIREKENRKKGLGSNLFLRYYKIKFKHFYVFVLKVILYIYNNFLFFFKNFYFCVKQLILILVLIYDRTILDYSKYSLSDLIIDCFPFIFLLFFCFTINNF